MKKNLLFLISIITLASLILASCGGGASSAPQTSNTSTPAAENSAAPEDTDIKPVKIALIQPLSGGNAESGNMNVDSANMAIKNINDAGGIKSLGGAPLELVIYDATSDPAQAKNVAERALEAGDIIAATGSGNSGLTLPMLPSFERAQIPLITYNNADDLTNQGYKYVFSITNRGREIGEYNLKFIEYLNSDLGKSYQKVGIIYENSANGISMAEGARTKAEQMGLEIVFDESYPAGTVDFAPMVTTLKNSGADVVMQLGYMQEAKLIFTAMRDIEYFPLVMGNSHWPSFYESLGDVTNGIICAGNWNATTKTVKESEEFTAIVNQFKDTYGYFMTEQAGPTYDCIMIIAEALEISGSRDPIALRDTISGTTFQRMQLQGKLEFNEAGENIYGMPVVCQWQYGEPKCVFPFEYAGAEYIDPAEFK